VKNDQKSATVPILTIFMVSLIMVVSCAGMSSSGNNEAVFSSVEGREWLLSEIRSGISITVDRNKLKADGFDGIYTVSFKDGSVSGMGMPNRFFGPYTASGMNLSMQNLAGTKMAALKEPDGLKENEYLSYLSRVTRWNLNGGKLELLSSNSSGSEAILVFVPK